MSLEDAAYNSSSKIGKLCNDDELLKNLESEIDKTKDELRFVSQSLFDALTAIDNSVITLIDDIYNDSAKADKLRDWYKNYEKKVEERRKDIIRHAKLKLTPEEIEALGL
jgi:hypothetical protein